MFRCLRNSLFITKLLLLTFRNDGHNIIMTSYKCYGVSTHRKLDCLFNSILRRTAKKSPKSRDTTLSKRECIGDCGFLLQGGGNAQAIPHHDDVIKWEQFPRCWAFVRGIHRSPVNSLHKGQRLGALMFSLLCVWINGWVNSREVFEWCFRRYRAHYDVTVMRISVRNVSKTQISRRLYCT